MVIDEYGTVGYSQQEIIDYLRINPNFDITGLFLTNGQSYEKARIDLSLEESMPPIFDWEQRKYDFTVEEYHAVLQNVWLMPEKYELFDVHEWLRTKAQTPDQLQRINEELSLYEKFGIVGILKYLKYLKDIADENGIVWGVGRGSSCASYCLYLLGIHRVDSLKFGLDIKEFLRD